MASKRIQVWVVMALLPVFVCGQSKTTIEQAVEGGKVLIELIKVFSNDKEKNEATGCKGRHADFCVVNARDTTLTVILAARGTNETRELIITTESRECCLQLPVGVWTYELKLSGMLMAMRKGDLLIEGCNNVTMTIK
jgi:hypothetical protein